MRSPAGPRIDASQATPAVGLDSGQAPVWKGIDTLPNELLLKIFANVDGEGYVLSDEFIHAYAAQVNTHQDDDASELHDDVRDYGDTRLLLPAMATCKQWRDLIAGTPTLWRRIVVYNNLHWLETCLERSRKLTVQVKFRHSTMNLSRAWKAIQPQKDRIAKLHFRWFECAQSGDLALEEMGQLTSLLVEVFHDEATTHNEVCSSLLLTPFPRLETLSLYGLTMQAPPSTLRKLVFRGCDGLSYRLTDFLKVLGACVSLAKLDVCECALDDIVFDIPQGHTVVALPRLRKLSIVGKVEGVSNLVSHLELGPDVDIWLATDPQEDIARAAVAALTVLPANIQSCTIDTLRKATRLKVDLSWRSPAEALVITATRGLTSKGRITIAVQVSEEQWVTEEGVASAAAMTRYYRTALQSIPYMFSGAPLDTLVCDGPLKDIDDRTWWLLFASFPTLQTLVVDSASGGGVSHLFHALSSLQSSQEPHPVCRHLEYLWLRTADPDDFEVVRQYVGRRAACDLPLRRLNLELDDMGPTARRVPDVAALRTQFEELVPDRNSRLVTWDVTNESDRRNWKDTEAEFPFGDSLV